MDDPAAAGDGAAAFAALAATYSHQAAQGEVLTQHTAALCGLVAEPPRSHSPKLGFLLLRPAAPAGQQQQQPRPPEVQVVMNLKFAAGSAERYAETWRTLGRGDLVRVEGHPGKTRTGTRDGGFSLFACSFSLLRMAPDPERALRLLLRLPPAGDARRGAEEAQQVGQEEEAGGGRAAEQRQELRRLLCSMLDGQHSTGAVLRLLQSLAGPRLQRRRLEDGLAAEGAAAAAAQRRRAGTAAQRGEAGCKATSAQRMRRIRAVASRRQRGLVVVLEDLEQRANIGAALRTCEAFGVATVCHVGAESVARPPHADPVVVSCSKSASAWLNHMCFESTEECMAWLRSEGVPSVATTPPHDELLQWTGQELEPEPGPGEGSCSAAAPPRGLYAGDEGLPWGGPRLAIWFGNESRGASRQLLGSVAEEGQQGCMSVPMQGMVESLNIAATVAVVLAEVVRQRSLQRAATGDAEFSYGGEELEALVQRLLAVSRQKPGDAERMQ